LPKELALAGITEMEQANRYIREKYLPAFNEEFMQGIAMPHQFQKRLYPNHVHKRAQGTM
jgi:hypothetical protein